MVKRPIHQGQQFKYLVDHSTIKSIASLAQLMSISHTAIYSLFKKEELEGKTIDKICQIFSVTPEDFVDKKLTGLRYTVAEPKTAGPQKEVMRLMQENSDLKTQLLESKDQIIALTTQLLKKK